MDHVITETSATGEEIGTIVHRLEEALDGAQRGHAIISCLSMVLIMMNPLITPEQLQSGVKDVSQFICLLLEGAGATPSARRG